MNRLKGIGFILGVVLLLTFNASAQDPHVDMSLNANNIQCDSDGRVNKIYYTSCFKKLTAPPYNETDDTGRLKAALANIGKIVFNEPVYYISDPLDVYAHRILEGTGKGSTNSFGYNNSKIIITSTNESIFRIGEAVKEVSIRDITFISNGGVSDNNVGILAEGGNVNNYASLYFDFSGLKFSNLKYGIKINATNNEWQFDNVKMSHLAFESCYTGIYVNSFNSGLDIRAINFFTPLNGYGIYMERGTYTSIDTLIGAGPFGSQPGSQARSLVYVKHHGIMSIKNSVSEGFDYDVEVQGNSTSEYSYPIHLINNHFQGQVYFKYATIVSTGNQYGHFQTSFAQPAATADAARIYSFGDKFCFESLIPTYCSPSRNFTLTNGAKLMFSSTDERNFTSVPTINDSNLSFVNNNTITIGSTTFSSLGTPANGTLYYCSNCQQTNPCSAGGSGSFAKRINGGWSCN